MNFTERIKDLRTKAQESQAANRIIDMLKDLESKNDENTAFRWVWELIQNAKDVPNSTGKVDIEIDFHENKKILEFKHNGRFFATKDIIFLIEQVSTKERGKIENRKENTTGKFGTGFLTTHLLSKKVTVSSYIKDEEEPISKFSIDLDRTSGEQKEIIASIEKSCNQLQQNSFEIGEAINENEYNTCFTYHLDNYGITVAKEGLKNLFVSAPFVFAFVPQINSICIKTGDINNKIVRSADKAIKLSNGKVISTIFNDNGVSNNRNIILYNDPNDTIEIAVEVEKKSGIIFLSKMNEKLPKLFCDFPLLGTNDFAFPVVINCHAFNPTEPRNGIFLTEKEDREDSDDVKSNKQFLLLATDLYKTLLDYFIKERYQGLYNIVKINNQSIKDWISITWLNNNIIEKLKSIISEEELVKTIDGNYCQIIGCFDDNLLIPTNENQEVRAQLWNLASKIYPNRLPQNEELENWYNSLWEECHNFEISDLIEKVANIGSLSKLDSLIGESSYRWLYNFYKLIYNSDYCVNSNSLDAKIVPNKNGDFCKIGDLKVIEGVDERYYNIARILNIDLKSYMVDENIAKLKLIYDQCAHYNFDDLCVGFKRQLNNYYAQSKEDFYRQILRLSAKESSEYTEFILLVKEFYEDDWSIIRVNNTSKELSEDALEFWMKKIIDDTENIQTLTGLSKHFGDGEINDFAISWLNKFYLCLQKFDKLILINNKDICPAQNGSLKSVSELFIDSGEISEETKDILALIDKDVRGELISKEIIFKPARTRKRTNEEIATPIINYIKANQKKLGNNVEEKNIFHNFYRYLRKNENNEAIKNVFEVLYSNLHWFYNDEDIASNMKKVEEYDYILSKYGVRDINQLESILSKSNTENKIEISSELLAQWGISTEAELSNALKNNLLGENFIYTSSKDSSRFNYVQEILKRSKDNVMKYLASSDEYDVSAPIQIAKTVFLIKKNNEEIYIIPRPSDYSQVVIYYNSELDILDYEKDCELWVENGISTPEKITFGKILKLTGVNKIPLKEIRKR